ncbi:VWA domain-containing protein [Chamaesiphon sp. VAR_48_metabat_403]|uniref:vWA domain-containing protein n=1 Tax=Chamaesiphon sp. VAR_48_metabat_403 TaxID=2964700 RepID=UPI00286DCC69|nr:VWA domain-containing protein [Chamaesiphon sp. VAR_48_metabat_403]
MLENRDYTLIIDKSGSMSTKDRAGGASRWQIMQESALALASKCEELDPDGITFYLFSGKFKRYDNVTAAKVGAIFQENDPSGRTDLAAVLKDATTNYLQRKAQGQIPANGEIILVVTDGEPDDRKAVMQVILDTTQKLDRDEELSISFIQVGMDEAATKFLKILDDDLGRAGAKFDIVDTMTMNDMEDLTLKEVLLAAISD